MPYNLDIFSKSQTVVHLNNLYVLDGLYVSDTSLVAIIPNQSFCWVYDIR